MPNSPIRYELQRADGTLYIFPVTFTGPLGLEAPQIGGAYAPDSTSVVHSDDGYSNQTAFTISGVWNGNSRDDVRAQINLARAAGVGATRLWYGPSYLLIAGGFPAPGSFKARNHTSIEGAYVVRIADRGGWYQGEGANRVQVAF